MRYTPASIGVDSPQPFRSTAAGAFVSLWRYLHVVERNLGRGSSNSAVYLAIYQTTDSRVRISLPSAPPADRSRSCALNVRLIRCQHVFLRQQYQPRTRNVRFKKLNNLRPFVGDPPLHVTPHDCFRGVSTSGSYRQANGLRFFLEIC